MDDVLGMMVVLLMAVLSGLVFFGGLYMTVRWGLTARLPALWFSMSMILRTGFVLGALYLSSAGRWERSLVFGAGFLCARLVFIRLSKVLKPASLHVREVCDAPESR